LEGNRFIPDAQDLDEIEVHLQFRGKVPDMKSDRRQFHSQSLWNDE
jgi:hypothetical protein